jgi:integral membrane protein (TIGR01906 family)
MGAFFGNKISWLILSVLLAVLLPIWLVTSNVRWVVNDLSLYSFGFNKFNIQERTGISNQELMSAARQIRSYFNNKEEVLNVTVEIAGVSRNIYNPKEIAHMRDVKGLIQGVYQLQEIISLYLGILIILGILARRYTVWKPLAGACVYGGIFTLCLIIIIGILSVVDFGGLFLVFHLVSFSNDLWLLDPSRDMLIRMFPQGFFMDATILIALGTIVEALVISGVGYLVLRSSRKW